ncbi:hypothetical protein LTR36_004638 [Oleoguttula mirabilis]|uniref:Uncharacterized protein n=1 Tax=Oleoguttula mirabilis TaxID=1507867 RepID=A0AAV9JG06_9PEZI|nr:hypothetical protein LTR36_004638 [Oleoguttula mirabilis]
MRDTPITDVNRHRLFRRPKCALNISAGHPPWLAEHPPLLAVSRQLRDEADEMYWGKNQWAIYLDAKREDDSDTLDMIDDDLHTPMQQMQKWVDMIGLHRLKHLRDFTMGIELCYKRSRCGPEEFRVRVDMEKGLQVELPASRTHLKGMREDVLGWIGISRSRAPERAGEGIVDYFLGEREFWSEWFFSYPEPERDWESEDSDEHEDDYSESDDDSGGDDDADESMDDDDEWEDERRKMVKSMGKAQLRSGRRSISGDLV